MSLRRRPLPLPNRSRLEPVPHLVAPAERPVAVHERPWVIGTDEPPYGGPGLGQIIPDGVKDGVALRGRLSQVHVEVARLATVRGQVEETQPSNGYAGPEVEGKPPLPSSSPPLPHQGRPGQPSPSPSAAARRS